MRISIFAGLVCALVGTQTAASAATLELAPLVPNEINVTADSTPGWIPTPEQQEQALKTVELYLDTIDGARYAEAYEMHAEVFRQQQTLSQFTELEEKVRTIAGSAEFWRALKITWSKDPARAPYPGTYAAIDLTALFEKADRYCGYIILYQEADGSDFVVMRREYSILDNASARSIEAEHSKEHLESLWAQMSQYCPNYVPITEAQ
jgi:hypothetical protein